jgi:glutamyl endopeptidase
MCAEYTLADEKHLPRSNRSLADLRTRPVTVDSSARGFDDLGLERVANFAMRSTGWEVQIADDDMQFPPAGSAAYASPENICQNDDRTQIKNTLDFPFKCIVKLYITGQGGNGWVGSGFFIGPRCIITNGHVVFPDNQWAKSIRVVPGQNGNTGPFGEQTSEFFYSVNGWIDSKDANYDYGAIILPDTKLFDRVRAVFGYETNNNPGILNNSGYPADKPLGTQWFNAGPVSKIESHRFFYMIDTVGGQSGSPVWIQRGADRIAVGVHAYGGCPNSAVRCIDDVATNWANWKMK